MAEIVKTVRIETGGGERSVKSLKKEISDLRDALLNMDKGGEEWIKTADELTKAQSDLNSVMKAGKQQVDADTTSIAGMEAQYKSLYQTYKLLSEEQRKTAKGISMQKELADLSKNLNETKKAAGNFKDNIGHYADDMMSAFGQLGLSVGSLQGPFKMATQGAGLFKKALDVLKAHPILGVLAALVLLFNKVRDAIKGNEELQMRMNNVMAAFKPIGDAVANILDTIAHVAVSVAEGIAKVVTWVNNLFNATKKLNEAEQEIAKTENELIKERREIAGLNAQDEARIAQLREEAGLAQDAVEKARLLTEAKELQEKVNKRNIELAQKELDLMKKQSEVRPDSISDKDALAAAEARVAQAQIQGANAMRTLDNGLASANRAASGGIGSSRQEIIKRLDEAGKTALEKLKEQYEKERKLFKNNKEQLLRLEQEYEKNVQQIRIEEWRKTQQYNNTELSMLVQPSTNAFATRRSLLQQDLMNATAAKLNLKNLPGTEDMVAAFDQEIRLTKAALQELNREEQEWNKTVSKSREELELIKTTYGENSVVDLLFGNTDNAAIAMGNANAAQGDFLRKRALDAKKAFDEIKDLSEDELNARGLTLNDRIEMERDFYEKMEALRQHDLQNQMEIRQAERDIEEDRINALHELKMTSLDAFSSILETTKELIEAYKKDGEISEQEAKRKAKTLQWLEGIQGAVAVAGIVADTAAGWMSINKSLAAEYVLNAQTAAATGPAAAATKAALDAKSLITANIRKAAILVNGAAAAAAAIGKTVANIKGLGDTGGADSSYGSASSVPTLIESTPYSYTRELQTNVEREEMLNTPIYVRVTDIDNAQARVRVTDREATF